MYIFYSIEFILGSVRKLENSTTYLFNQIHYHWLENISRSKLPPVFEVLQRKAYFLKYVHVYCTYVISLTSSPREATSVATNILVCPSLKSSKACSLSHCSLQWKYYSLTHFYMYASNLFTSTMYFAIIVQLLIPVNWFLFPQNNQKLSLQMLTCLHEYTGSWSY